MGIWFVRSNGETLHNNPASPLFVPSEPPTFPDRTFDYRAICLRDGFVRVGWPATGDLRLPDWPERASRTYRPYWDSRYQRYLEQFLEIQTGDIVVMPSGLNRFSIHVGAVVLREASSRQIRTVRPRLPAYSYHYDVSCRVWFETAHRVDVLWDADATGRPATHEIPSLGGIWRRAFGGIGSAANEVRDVAVSVGLPIAT